MEINNKRDGHIHTPFCPHGSDESFDVLVEKAIAEGLEEITFTEHMTIPLPKDPSPRNDSSMKEENIEPYIKALMEVKEKYKHKIKVNIGFEVDYIEGIEQETKTLLDKYGKYLDDAILSVHVLRYDGQYYPIGSGSAEIVKLVDKLGGMDKVYNLYYETILKSIKADLGKYKPKRIGHPTLVRKYRTDLPNEKYDLKLLEEVVIELKEKGYSIDFNTSGLRKEKCGETYPSGVFKELILKYNVPMVLGSDAHCADQIALFFKEVSK